MTNTVRVSFRLRGGGYLGQGRGRGGSMRIRRSDRFAVETVWTRAWTRTNKHLLDSDDSAPGPDVATN